MAKYDYKVQQIPEGWSAQDLEDALKVGGRAGWMLQGLYQAGKAPNEKFFVIAVKVLAQ